MKRILILQSILLLMVSCTTDTNLRTVSDFNFDWTFSLGDNQEWVQPSFNDSTWRRLHLPHDWSIEGQFSDKHPAGIWGGALPGGIGWYRKHFITPSAERVFIEFDGVYMNSTVYVNGKEVGTRPYGYSSFSYDVTSFLRPQGEDNVIAVRVDNSQQPNSRWYSGSGIYRNVRMVTTGLVHVAWQGTYVTTPTISDEEAIVDVKIDIEAPEGTSYQIKNIIKDADGRQVAVADDGQKLRISNPHRWDIHTPYLYTLTTEVLVGNKVVDRYDTPFGIRTTGWDKDKGFILNGRSVKLLGVCLHHDMGCIGTAVHRRAIERQLTIMKDMGVNAIRTTHNPPTPELLELCDEMGLLVMDEAFDTWRHHKAKYDYATYFDEWHERDLKDFVRRDRNHPSVILWSIGNEIYEQAGDTPEEQEANRQLTTHLAELVRQMDDTRAVTSGTHAVFRENNIINSNSLDVIGLNYHNFGYDSLRIWHPTLPIVASETASALNSRGVYYQPSTEMRILPQIGVKKVGEPTFQCTAYDMCHAFWDTTCTHQDAWKVVRDHDFVAGTFVWTGFDYLGEPTAYGWPARSSYFGIVDLAGFPKDPYYMYQAEWTNQTVLHLHPHWNWKEGDKVDVWAYYNLADEVELFLNGKSLGRSAKTSERLHAFWPEVVYEPGELLAISYKNGKEVARDTIKTAGQATCLRLSADRPVIEADGYDLSFVTIEALDKHGVPVPTADLKLEMEVTGSGELYGVDNGNAADTLCLKGSRMSLFNGKALAVVRSIRNMTGEATLKVRSEMGETLINIQTTSNYQTK